MNTLRALGHLAAPPAWLAVLALTACDPDFDPGTQVDSLRVLAVRADSPFAHPGDTVHLSALSYDPAGRAINWAWAACPSPAGSSVEDCLDQVRASAAGGELPLLAMGAGIDSIDIPVPADALDGIPLQARSQALAGELVIEQLCGDRGSGLPAPKRLDTGRVVRPFEDGGSRRRLGARVRTRAPSAQPLEARAAAHGADRRAIELGHRSDR